MPVLHRSQLGYVVRSMAFRSSPPSPRPATTATTPPTPPPSNRGSVGARVPAPHPRPPEGLALFVGSARRRRPRQAAPSLAVDASLIPSAPIIRSPSSEAAPPPRWHTRCSTGCDRRPRSGPPHGTVSDVAASFLDRPLLSPGVQGSELPIHRHASPNSNKEDNLVMSSHASPLPVASALPTDRALFVRLTYGHLALAVLAFITLESLLLRWPGARDLAARMTEGYNWLVVMIVFAAVSSFADRWARNTTSISTQYLGLAVAIVAQSVLFLPLLLGIATGDRQSVIASAGIITALMAAGLTAVVVVTRADFSFLRTALTIGGFVAIGLIVAAIVVGFDLGLGFAFAMVLLAVGSILYQTSNVLRAYRTDQHVAAALALFASVALLFWWIVTIVGANRR